MTTLEQLLEGRPVDRDRINRIKAEMIREVDLVENTQDETVLGKTPTRAPGTRGDTSS